MNYEEKIEKLIKILEQLEGQKMPLDETIKLYDEAKNIYVECSDYLEKAKGNVYKIKQELDKYNEEKMK